MSNDLVLYERRGPSAWITLNRPEKLNSMTYALVDQFEAAMDRAEADDDTHGFRRKFACAVLGCGDRRNGAAGNGGGDAGAKLATGHQNSPRIVIGGAPGPAGQAATA